jgi:hypothetical protein
MVDVGATNHRLLFRGRRELKFFPSPSGQAIRRVKPIRTGVTVIRYRGVKRYHDSGL